MTPLFLDTETYCETPIGAGTHRYAEGAEVTMWQWAVGLDGPVVIREQDEPIDDLLAMLGDPEYEIVIHNAAFDRTVCRHVGIDIPLARTFDTMACALAHSLPGALGALCDVLGVPVDKAKDRDGYRLIQLFGKPLPANHKLRRATRETHPEEWAKFRQYGGLDIEAMREVYKRLPRWNYRGFELDLWRLDQTINERGVCVDLDLAHAAIRATTRAQKIHAKDVQKRTGYVDDEGELTGEGIKSANQRDKMIEFILEAHGVLMEDMKKGTLEKYVDDPGIPKELRELLAVRLQASKSSASKYRRVINGVSSDGRLRGLVQFCGASRTGRWAGRLFQPHNMPRPTIKNAEIARGIEALKHDAEDLL